MMLDGRALTRAFALAALLGGAVLATGCSRQEPEAEQADNIQARTVEAPAPEPSAEASVAPAERPPEPGKVAEATPTPANSDAVAADPVAPDAQMLDDADATGLTARTDRSAAVEDATDKADPADR